MATAGSGPPAAAATLMPDKAGWKERAMGTQPLADPTAPEATRQLGYRREAQKQRARLRAH